VIFIVVQEFTLSVIEKAHEHWRKLIISETGAVCR